MQLMQDAVAVVTRYHPEFVVIYSEINWKMYPKFSRVYDNTKARLELGWKPKYDFKHVLSILSQSLYDNVRLASMLSAKEEGDDNGNSRYNISIASPLACVIGKKYYHKK